MIEAWIFIGVPLALYAVTFAIELYISFARLFRERSVGDYLDATWEITFTFLILAMVNFVNLFSSNIDQIANAFFLGIFIVGAFLVMRAILYLVLFYVRSDQSKRDWMDWLFALSHLGIIGGLIVLVAELIPVISTQSLTLNEQFIPYMWVGLILVALLSAIPLTRLYFSSTKPYDR